MELYFYGDEDKMENLKKKNAFLEEDVHKYGQLTFGMLTIHNKGQRI